MSTWMILRGGAGGGASFTLCIYRDARPGERPPGNGGHRRRRQETH